MKLKIILLGLLASSSTTQINAFIGEYRAKWGLLIAAGTIAKCAHDKNFNFINHEFGSVTLATSSFLFASCTKSVLDPRVTHGVSNGARKWVPRGFATAGVCLLAYPFAREYLTPRIDEFKQKHNF